MTSKMWRRIGVVSAIILFLLLVLLATIPFGLFKGLAEQRLSARFGRPVTIGALSRLDTISFTPRVRIEGLRVPQADWAGRGDMIRIARLEARLSVLPMLIGRMRLRDIHIAGLDAILIRAADRRESWSDGRKKRAGGPPPVLASIDSSRLRYIDYRRDRSFDAAIALDARGFRLDGDGLVKGHPVRMTVRGAPVRSGPWPFQANLDGPSLAMSAAGRMDHAFDLDHLDAQVIASATNLTLIDAIIEAGLPATQPVRLTAQVRRDWPDWTVRTLAGTIGRSDIAGMATIRKRDGRTLIDGRLHAARFDFDDLTDARSRAIAAEKRRRFGARLFPDTAIDLRHVARTDGTLRLHVDRLLWPGPSPFRSLDGTLRIDHSLLDIRDLRMGLTHGALRGRVSIDQRAGGPIFAADLRLDGARLVDFAPGSGLDAPMRGRWVLSGPGKTIRRAIGRSTGHVAVVASDGVVPAQTASLLGQDLGGLLKGKDKQAQLRCLIVRFDAKDGIATADPVMIDTSRAVTRATGTIDLATERLAMAVNGAPKRDVALRIPGAVPVNGTIKAPAVSLPEGRGVAGSVLKAIGRALDGKAGPVAEDQDCPRAMAAALRR